jgi:hypothetical protein
MSLPVRAPVNLVCGGLCWTTAVMICVRVTLGVPPEYKVSKQGLDLVRARADCPMIYDNDWWKDVPDAAYLWAKASLGQADLRGNVVSRDMWDWQKGYTYKLEQGLKDARSLLEAARKSGLSNIPEPVLGANEALVRPKSGKIEETKFVRTPGSELIVAEGRKATIEKPLLVFAGGPCTTVATAYLTDPSIADRMIVFQIDCGGYNGKDSWSWKIAQDRLPFANWARSYFWGEWSKWGPERFQELPDNPLGDALRDYAKSGLGKANQWGDGPWIFYVFDRRSLTKASDYDGTAITIPREGTNVPAMEVEFFKTMKNAAVYHKK